MFLYYIVFHFSPISYFLRVDHFTDDSVYQGRYNISIVCFATLIMAMINFEILLALNICR
jgi:hypothetical protein